MILTSSIKKSVDSLLHFPFELSLKLIINSNKVSTINKGLHIIPLFFKITSVHLTYNLNISTK